MKQSAAKRPLLDSIGARLYAFLARKIGYSTTPKPVPLYLVAKAIGCTYEQARYRIETLERMNLIEKWTTKHNTQYKITYYRLTYSDPFLEEERKKEGISRETPIKKPVLEKIKENAA